MGSVVSTNNISHSQSSQNQTSQYNHNHPNKRPKLSSSPHNHMYPENSRLIPSLPDEISLQILARIPRIHHLTLKSVSRNWRSAILSSDLFHLRKELQVTEEWVYILTKMESNKLCWHGFDPVSGLWQQLPPMPYFLHDETNTRLRRGSNGSRMWNVIGSTIRIADFVRGWFSRRDGAEQLPFCGCAVAAVGGCLYVLGGFARSLALSCVWRYDPRSNSWDQVGPMGSGRAFCKTGVLDGKLYVIGGVSRARNGRLNPLRSGEVFDPLTGTWEPVPDMPFTKAQILPAAFLADVLKPVATGMACFRQRLYVTQSLYSWPFFFDIGGEVFDPRSCTWGPMPAGMGDGWPARQAGTKLGLVVNGDLYALEPSSSLDSGMIKRYDSQEDAWKIAVSRVPVRDFTESEAPFLLAGFHESFHVITKDGDNNISVLRARAMDGTAGSSSDTGSSSSSSSSSGSGSSSNLQEGGTNEDNNSNWRLIAARNFGMAELVSCQVLDL
ncbi:F-box/kelch-repeat protein [Rhynchospora pubera]|uniref:F-box/kelch-repeat protein n=1 Tax=Rhynchospora pubera TaxID=906938 RepID=A0AAV8HP30_9POAL|nr:F-box/kelch-repeat protein [Rhynchospora pubera]